MRIRQHPWRAGVLALALVLVIAGAVAVWASPADGPGRIELSAAEFSLGTIPNTEPVSAVFQVRNAGAGTLHILGVSTSCGCTTAEIGARTLARGEVTDLRVTFDPQAHGGATGSFTRLVYVRSDDPDRPEVSLALRVEVVAAQ
jgi:hypothetical protein